MLQSPDVELRISAGETLALVYEMRRHSLPSYRMINHRDLTDRLQAMAHEGQKSKAKKDLKLQRSSFRDIANYIDRRDVEVETHRVKITKSDILELTSWVDKLMYHVLCDVFASGLKRHLQENVFIREHVFEMEPWAPEPVIADEKSMKAELKRCRRLEGQARYLSRQKGRAKRQASISSN